MNEATKANEIEALGPPSKENLSEPRRGFLIKIIRLLPNGLVLAALVGVALWGHHTGWKMPKYSALHGSTPAGKGDWCDEHGVPESVCVECQPDLMPRSKEYGWCKTHGVPDCPWEHHEVAQVKGRAEVSPADLEWARRALATGPRPENNSKCKLNRRRIQFASLAAFEKAGVEAEPVGHERVVEAVTANGEVTYDQTRIARLSARVPGTVWRVARQVGEAVRQGDVLALVDAAEVGRAKSEFLHALAQVELRGKTFENLRAAGGSVPDRTVREAETAFREAQIRLSTSEQALVNLGLPVAAVDVRGLSPEAAAARLRFLGLPDDLARTFDPRTTTANLLPLKAPLDGVIVAREVVAGEVVDIAKVLFVVADVSRMWLTLNVRLEDARKVSLRKPVRFRTDAVDGEVRGTVAWISTAVDEKTRTLKVRADLDNADGRLAAHAFGTGQIVLRDEPEAVVVPNEAVHWEGDCHVVFVRDKDFLDEGAPKVFHTRTVRLGVKDGKYTEIIAGVLPGEVVATRGSGVLRSELLKSNIGEA